MRRTSLFDRLALFVAERHARSTLERFLRDASAAGATQRRILREKLSRNADSDFGRRHGFESIRGPEEFAARVPISTYDDLSPYIERMREGRTAALLGAGQRVLMYALTSGTTNEPKYIPVTPAFLDEYRRGWNVWGLRALLDHPGCFLRHIVQVSSPMNDSITPSGIPCGAITGLMAATQKRLVRKYYTAPLAVAHIKDATAKYYTIMRLAVPRDVAFLIAANPATLLLLARTANEHRETIIRDVRDGTLSTAFNVPGAVCDALRRCLRPDPASADRLARIASHTDALRPKDYWNLGFVAHWTGGTMGLYRARFPEWYGNVPVRDPGLLASEGRMSVPIEDNTAAGVLDVTSHYFEFIPAEDYDTPARRACTIADLQVGGEYFLLLTTSSGLCRYDIGDRVRVTGFFGEAPVIEFLSKAAHTSSLTGEKLTEHQVVAAMRAVAGGPDNFVLAPCWSDPPYYRLYVDEASVDAGQLAVAFDRRLSEQNVEYASKRASQRLEGIEVCPLPAGTLARLDDRQRQKAAGRSEQFKHRYLLPQPGMDEDLLATRAPAESPG
jgi:hypothetical protein